MRIFTGLSAFPLTPMTESQIDEHSFVGLVTRIAAAGADSVGALGSTGSYAYLTAEERSRAARLAVEAAGSTPVIVGIGALRTRDVCRHAESAQAAGAYAVLLAPMSYQPLTAEEVYGLYETVTKELSVPLCVYDNPGTTHFTFTDELHARIAQLPNIASIKIPGVPAGRADAAERIDSLRARIPATITLGISNDPTAATGLNAGCDLWYSVLAGVLPAPCVALTRAAQAGDAATAAELSDRFEPLWTIFRSHGSLRTVSAIAEDLGLVSTPNLPAPVRGLPPDVREAVSTALRSLRDLI
ncbi:dihydrodipicolinate synthase family protein [Nocardia sp. NPDC024068]|uniref:dihydrodipicolinate synthase family protein n=1 Tax=Nocardia sp. NPDC024068 TaxID=3157197 RepID=UPI0033E27D93